MKLVTIYTKSATIYIKLNNEEFRNLQRDIIFFDANKTPVKFTILKDINDQTVIVNIPYITSLHTKDLENNPNNPEEFEWPDTII
jgi:hypothetical protein